MVKNLEKSPQPLTGLSVDLLANAMKTSSDAIVIKNRFGTILIGSQGVADFFQCNVDDLPGRNAYDHLPQDVAVRTRERDRIVFESGEAESGEEIWDLGYERRTFLVSRAPIRDSSHEIVGVITSYKNISPIKQAFEFFEQNRKRIEALAETCPVGIFECNPYHQLTYVNPEWERITGLHSSQVLSQNWAQYVVSDHRALVEELIDRADAKPGVNRVDLLILGTQECTVELSLSTIRDAENHVVSYIGSVVDLTYRMAAQKQLREKAALLRDLTSSVPAIIWQMSLDGQCVFASDHWMEITGQPMSTVLGRGWENFIHPEDVEKARSNIESVLTNQRQKSSYEFRLKGKDGDWRWVLSICQQIHTIDGKFMGVAGHAIDITQRRKAELELQQYSVLLEQRVSERTHELVKANESLRSEIDTRIQAEELLEEKRAELAHFSRISVMGRLSGELAHELNQPLNAIQNYVASLAKIIDSPSMPESATHVLNQLNKEITRAAKIIRRTREFVSAGKHQSEELRLADLVSDTVAMLKGEARRRGMKIVAQDCDQTICVYGDAVRLQQVLVNLVLNGLESMVNYDGSDMTVAIEIESDAEKQTILVHDTGCGVRTEELARLFDAFFTTKPTGLGMGLAISRAIIEEHGGSLDYLPRDGGGSTFRIELPNANR